jgi:hypothetical protein
LITGLISNLIPLGIAIILQYADDTIFCLEHDLEEARNMKLLLYLFEQMSGLKIKYAKNFNCSIGSFLFLLPYFEKSEILILGGGDELAVKYAKKFNCSTGSFLLKYLGVPISPGRLHVIDWMKLKEKLAKKLDVW